MSINSNKTCYYYLVLFIVVILVIVSAVHLATQAAETYCDNSAEVSPSDAAAAEEAASKDEGADRVECDADRVDWNSDKAGVAGRFGAHNHSECDQ